MLTIVFNFCGVGGGGCGGGGDILDKSSNGLELKPCFIWSLSWSREQKFIQMVLVT